MEREYINQHRIEEPGVTYHKASRYFKDHISNPSGMFNPVGQAFNAPNERIKVDFEDIGMPRNRWYAGYIRYNTESDTLETWGNVAFNCPNRHHHHVGSTCGCCHLHG